LSGAYHFKRADKEAVQHIELAFLAVGDKDFADAVLHEFDRGDCDAIAEWLLRRDQEKARKQYVSPLAMGFDYARLQRKEETLHALEGAFQERPPFLVLLQKTPLFDFLHSEPRYRILIKKMGLPPAY